MRVGFTHSEIPGSKLVCQLPGAYRRLLRPSSPVIAKASTTCTYSLDPITLSPRACARSHRITGELVLARIRFLLCSGCETIQSNPYFFRFVRGAGASINDAQAPLGTETFTSSVLLKSATANEFSLPRIQKQAFRLAYELC